MIVILFQQIKHFMRFIIDMLFFNFTNQTGNLRLFNIQFTWNIRVFHCGTDFSTDTLKFFKLHWSNKGNCNPFFTRTSCTSDTMNITLRIEWDMVVENVSNVIDVQSARRNVCRDQYINGIGFKPFDNTFTLTLLHVTM